MTVSFKVVWAILLWKFLKSTYFPTSVFLGNIDPVTIVFEARRPWVSFNFLIFFSLNFFSAFMIYVKLDLFNPGARRRTSRRNHRTWRPSDPKWRLTSSVTAYRGPPWIHTHLLTNQSFSQQENNFFQNACAMQNGQRSKKYHNNARLLYAQFQKAWKSLKINNPHCFVSGSCLFFSGGHFGETNCLNFIQPCRNGPIKIQDRCKHGSCANDGFLV